MQSTEQTVPYKDCLCWLKHRNYVSVRSCLVIKFVLFNLLVCFSLFFQSDGYFTALCFVPRVAADIQM